MIPDDVVAKSSIGHYDHPQWQDRPLAVRWLLLGAVAAVLELVTDCGQRELAASPQLRRVRRAFLEGFRSAILSASGLPERLDRVELDYRGFAYEGAAFALALHDCMGPAGHLCSAYLASAAESFIYTAHVGIGWATTWLPSGVRDRLLSEFDADPLLKWLIYDGEGFARGLIQPRRYLHHRQTPDHLSGYSQQVFTQGLGRSLWFNAAGEPERIISAIDTFPAARQADLWSGIGLACVYAGGVSQSTVETIRDSAGDHRLEVAQGAAFAAKARQRGGNISDYTRMTCGVLTGLSPEDAAEKTDQALVGLPEDGVVPAYAEWRRRVRCLLTSEGVQ